MPSPGERGTPRELGDAETFTAGRAGRVHGYAPRLHLPRPLGLRLSSGCGGRAPQGGPWSVSRRFRGFLGGSHACAPQPAGRRGPAQALPVCALEPTSSLGLCSLQAHHFPGVGRTGESEQRPARAPEPGGHLSSI